MSADITATVSTPNNSVDSRSSIKTAIVIAYNSNRTNSVRLIISAKASAILRKTKRSGRVVSAKGGEKEKKLMGKRKRTGRE